MDVTREESDHTTQGLRQVRSSIVSLSRLSRSFKRAKLETKVICHQWHKETFISDVFGTKDTWLVPGYEAAEWGFILYLFKTHSITRIIRLSIVTVGSVIIPPLGLLLYTRFLLAARSRTDRVRMIGSKYAHRNREAGEEWWFVNGTGVNGDLQAANGYHISEIFQKQVRLFYNPTTGLLFDMAQCAVGLISYRTRPSTLLARSLLTSFAQDPNVKIILVVHSMGAIIACNAIKYLIRKGHTKDLRRLELYTFGSPAVEFLHVVDRRTLTRAPFYEHFVNTGDYFGRIGAMRLKDSNWWAVGRVFIQERQGHFFGEHYLTGVPTRAFKWRGTTEHSRLYSYLPPYPTPAVAPFNPYSIPEYQINPRRPRRNVNISTTPASLPIPASEILNPTEILNLPTEITDNSSTHDDDSTNEFTITPPSPLPYALSSSLPPHSPELLSSSSSEFLPLSSPELVHPSSSSERMKVDTFSLPASQFAEFMHEFEQNNKNVNMYN